MKARKKAKSMESKRKIRMTAHRIAAEKPETRDRIELLRKRWKRAKPPERRARVADLRGRDCTIRGLAEDIGQVESAVRYYSKPAPGSPKTEKPSPIKVRVSVKGSTKQKAVASAEGKQRPVSPNDPSGGTRKLPELSGKRQRIVLPPRPLKRQEKALPNDKYKEEESLESLRLLLPEIIIDFIRTKLGSPDAPASSNQIQALLATLRMCAKVDFPWIRAMQLPDPITVNDLYERTRPKFTETELNADQLGKWLAVILTCLASGDWERAIEPAEHQLIPQPEQKKAPPLDSISQRQSPSFRIAIPSWRNHARSRVPSRTDGW